MVNKINLFKKAFLSALLATSIPTAIIALLACILKGLGIVKEHVFLFSIVIFLFFMIPSVVIEYDLERRKHDFEIQKTRKFLLGILESLTLNPKAITDLALMAQEKGNTELASFLKEFRKDSLEQEILYYLEKSKKMLD